MKKLIPLIVLLLVCSSCDGLLSPEPLSEVTTGNFYQTEADIEQALSSTYANMKGWPVDIYLLMSEVRSKNYIEVLSTAQRDWADLTSFNANSQTGTVGTVWINLYRMVNRSNAILENIDGVAFDDESLKARYRAEARFLRAMAHFQLGRIFGRAPLVTSVISPQQGTELGQSEQEELYTFAASEMEEVLGSLPDRYPSGQAGRITEWGARGILARVYLTMEGASVGQDNLSNARGHLEAVMSEEGGDVTFADSYEELFAHVNENQYYLFEVQFVSGGTGAGTPLPSYVVPALISLDEAPYGTIISANRLGLSEDLLDSYDPQDQRFDVTIDTLFIQDPDPSAEPGTPEAVPDTGRTPYYTKFLPSEEEVDGLGLLDRYDWPVNFPILRYADVLLMYAEVVSEQAGSPTSEAVSILNRIRDRAGLAPVNPAGMAEWESLLETEYRHEFAAEGKYWFYLIRTNQAVDTMNDWFQATEQNITIDENQLVYPIPQSEIDVYPDLYQQNPGY